MLKKQSLLFDINAYKSTEPPIKLIQDERFYVFRPRKYVLSARYKHLRIRHFLTSEEYSKYLKFEKKAKLNALNLYTKNDRCLIFLHFVLKLGRRRMHKLTGISERYIYEFLRSLKK